MPYFQPPRAALALALIAGAFATTNARAADLDPGYADVPPPVPQQMVTFGSGWYVRGDIGATEAYKVEYGRPEVIQRTHNAAFDAALGGGYAFTNQIRADANVDFFQPTQACSEYTGRANCRSFGQLQRYAAFVNGYYDIGTWSIVTPYIGVGAGAAFSSLKVSYPIAGTALRQNATTFAFAVMAGLSFDVYAHTKLDVGYRYVNEGSVFGAKVYDHQVRAGLRYMIDN